MSQENSYQEQTGQVAPTAQNPQTGSLQPYQQQTAENLQTTTDQLLSGQSGVSLVLPNGTSTVEPTGVTKVDSGSANGSLSTNSFITSIPILLVISWVIIMIILFKQSNKTEPTEQAEGNKVVEEPQALKINIDFEADQEAEVAPESAPEPEMKAAKSSQKSSKKKSKKRKKKK
ncbi:hypothetical protein KDA00_04250 [Candidatus Saccharibacteria bacterium]|nr:hypothetical protein [Candidatus Saccharibacteria bacterium]